MKRLLLIALLATALLAATKPLPTLGTKFHTLPEGAGKSQTEGACFRCHSADMLMQQRLTEKQWTSTVEKMMRWGANVPEGEKASIIAYLSKHFGPDNNKFTPIRTKPVGR
jgi:hypothetical protein